MQHEEGFDYKRIAGTNAGEKRQAPSQSSNIWRTAIGSAIDKYERRYFEGKLTLSEFKNLHRVLADRHSQRAGHDQTNDTTNRERGDKNQTAVSEPVIRAKSSLDATLARKGRDKALSECQTHQARAAAFGMLAERCRELGMESNARSYEPRATLERASAQGFAKVVKAYDRQLEDQGIRPVPRREPPDLHSISGRTEQAERHLDAYHHSRIMALLDVREVQKLETEIRRLEAAYGDTPTKPAVFEDAVYQRDIAVAKAEEAALASIALYRRYQEEIHSVHKDYDALSLALTGKPLDPIKTHLYSDDFEKTEHAETLHEAEGDLEGPGRIVTEKTISDSTVKEPERDKPKLDAGPSDPNRLTIQEQRRHRVTVGVVAGQILREMDREI